MKLLVPTTLAIAGACGGAPHPTTEPTDVVDALGYTIARTGGPHDFDWIAGAWTAVQRRLVARGVGSTEWDEFPSSLCATPYLGGVSSVEEVVFPTKGWSGLTLRAYNTERRQWAVYWINSKRGVIDPPVVGGFDGDRGAFYGEDTDEGKPIKVRYEWTLLGPDRARWEQAFSYDDKTWEVNWTADFTRADPATTCERGRPR